MLEIVFEEKLFEELIVEEESLRVSLRQLAYPD